MNETYVGVANSSAVDWWSILIIAVVVAFIQAFLWYFVMEWKYGRDKRR